jgi:DNA-binding CsgD family transcriptional regulator
VEERVYRQVIAAGGGTARVTARVLRLPPVEVEQALARLLAMTLITRAGAETLSYVPGQGVAASGSREVHYVPEPPNTTLGAMLQTQAAGLISAGATVEQLSSLYDRRHPDGAGLGDAARVVVGSGVNEAVYEMLCGTRVEILNLDRQPFVRPADPHPLLPAMLGALERGVAVRTIYAGDAFRVAGYNEYIRQACELGEQARLLNHLPIRFMVSDGSSALLPLASDGPWVTAALVVHGHVLVEDLVHTFEDLWARAAMLTNDQGADDGFSEAERALLRMLSTDMTDTAISRHLGTSPRTIGRRLSQLQHKLGAATRFGMGVEATRRGLL